jgi:hypothetical protein
VSETALEFRVLGGVHEGAVVALPAEAGDAGWTVGRDERADIVLTDLPCEQARLRWQADGWQWQDPAGETDCPWGQALRLAGLGLQCSPTEAPWPGATQWRALPDRLAQVEEAVLAAQAVAVDTGEPASSAEGASPRAGAEPDAEVRETASSVPPHRRPATRWRRRGLALGSAVLVLGLAGAFYLVLQGVVPAPQQARQAPVPEPALDPVTALQGVQKKLQALGLAGRVRAQALPDGRIRLIGVVASDEVLDGLLGQLMPWTPQLSLEVLTQAEFARHVAALAPRWPRLALRAGTDGRVLVEGRAGPDLDTASLSDWIAQAIPEAAGVGLEGLQYPPSPQAEALAAQAARPRLPQVTAVVSGERAYVLLADGRRLLPGAQVRQGLTVARIDDNEVIFQTLSGQTFAMNRGRP